MQPILASSASKVTIERVLTFQSHYSHILLGVRRFKFETRPSNFEHAVSSIAFKRKLYCDWGYNKQQQQAAGDILRGLQQRPLLSRTCQGGCYY
jgi:hypothetical protein